MADLNERRAEADRLERRAALLERSKQNYRLFGDVIFPLIDSRANELYAQEEDHRERKWEQLEKYGLDKPYSVSTPSGGPAREPSGGALHGLLGAMYTGGSWMGLPVSAVTNGVTRNLANAADYATSTALGSEPHMPYPDATTNAIRDINTFSFNLPEYLIGRALPSHDVTRPMDLQDTYETLRDYNVPDYAAIPLGGVTDAALDAWNPGGFLRARALPLSKGLQQMATDFGPEIGVRVLGGLVGDHESSGY